MYSLDDEENNSGNQPVIINCIINNKPVTMEGDTGSSVTIINNLTYDTVCSTSQCLLESTSIHLRTYTGEYIPVIGRVKSTKVYKNYCL